jgi:hypothetical protein
MYRSPNSDEYRLKKSFSSLIPSVFSALLLLSTQARADVLLKGKTPIDRGHGDTVGDRIRWISCDGRHSEIADPPYTVYKRRPDTECERSSAQDQAAKAANAGFHPNLDPSLFGLDCPSRGVDAAACKVEDKKLARHFFARVERGDVVEYHTKGDKITLTYGDEKLDVDSSEWQSQPYFPIQR